ncbi:MAG: 23S rRNA (pseudouridine(1915)-N(3))-methyltransferase RlmH [Pseudomonadota bacterium]
MHIKVLAIGNKMPAWVTAGVQEYQKRLPREWRFQWVELPLGSRSKSQSTAKAIEQEGQSLLAALIPGERVIALDVNGKSWSTETLSTQLDTWQLDGSNLALMIGGPDGLSPACLERADLRWSLSPLTLPHPLVRIVLTEQLYRGWTLLNNHPYHK